MITNSKIVIVALAALLFGVTVGALVMHRSNSQPETLTAASSATASPATTVAQPDPSVSPSVDQAKTNEDPNAVNNTPASGEMAASEQGRVYQTSRTRYSRRGSYYG